MKNPRFRASGAAGSVLALILFIPAVSAQPPAPAPSPQRQNEAVVLDPFEVQASSDKSYGDLNSNSITAFAGSLDKMPVSADVFDQAFMNDTAFSTVEQMLDFYSAGSGQSSTAPDIGAQNGQLLDRPSNATFSVRGLSAPTALINGFFPGGLGTTGGGMTANFDLDKVEVINGPQALLYGVSGAGGAINFTTKQAVLGRPAYGALAYQIDQYGHKQGQLDFGAGSDRFALRLALIDQTFGSRRVYLGGPMRGAYLQIAIRPVQNTIIRLTGEQQTFDRIYQTYQPTIFTAASTSNDARNGDDLRYLLATNQLQAAANGAPSGAGPIPGLNWDNIDSLGGNLFQEYRDYHRETVTVDTNWTSWLSSEVAAGYSSTTDWRYSDVNQVVYDAPNVSANPTGTFAISCSTTVTATLDEPGRLKAGRVSILSSNDLFQDRVHSKTIVGGDANRSEGGNIEYYYVQADANWNPIITASSTTYNGMTPLATQYYAVPNGPVPYPGVNPTQTRITVNGVNYVRAITNDTNKALISPSNPEGLTGIGKGDYRHSSDINSGVFAANYSEFFGGNLTSLVGARAGKSYYRNDVEGSATTNPSIITQANANYLDIDAGLDAKVAGGLRAYANISESANPPTSAAAGPTGRGVKVSTGFGEEVGLKETIPSSQISGQLALYHTQSKNEELAFTSTFITDINPTGINGQFGAPSNVVNVSRQTRGGEFTITAAPTNWRLRFSAAFNQATTESTVAFGQLYNDQFYENSAGQVTYADGTVVYVNPTYNSKGVIAAPAPTAPAGYIPLTVALMNTSSSPYYANPVAVTGQISASSNVHNVLLQTDPAHGPIATGALGLPISALQIAPNAASPPPGTIVVAENGDSSAGVPKYAANFAAVYTIPGGPAQGLELGALGSFTWDLPFYYYYPAGTGALNVPRVAYYEPTQAVLTGLLGYTRKFRRITFHTQLNVNNLFNHYHVLILPSLVNGYNLTTGLTATFDQQPRTYVWTSRVSF